MSSPAPGITWYRSPRACSTAPTAWSRSPGPALLPGSVWWCLADEHTCNAGTAGAGTRIGHQDISRLTAGDRAGRGEPEGARRGADGDRRAVRVGEDHAAAPGRDPGPADLRHGAGHRPRCRRFAGPGSGGAAGRGDWVHLPAVLPRRARDRGGQRRRRAAVPRDGARATAAAGRSSAGAGRARAQAARPPDPAVRGGAAAGRGRPRPGRPAGHRAGRRADRQPGPENRHRTAGTARRAQRGGHHDRGHHPRPAGRRPDAPPDHHARRPHHHRHRRPRRPPAAGRRPGSTARRNPTMTAATLPSSPAPAGRPSRLYRRRLRPADLAHLAAVGLRTRKLRASLSALGIAIGVAAIVAVLGLSASSQAGLLAQISKLGTNLLTVQNGQNLTGGTAELPKAAPAMIGQLNGVTSVQDTGTVSHVNVFRSPLIPTINTNALTVDAASIGLPATVGTSLAQGRWLNAATAREPVAVLGAAAAQRLGVDRIYPGERIWLGGQWFYVTGILHQAVLAPGLNSAVFVGFPAAEKYLSFDGHPSTVYLRAATSKVQAVDNLLAYQANPQNPTGVTVAQPSAALTAQEQAKGAFNGLFLGLGAVALLVGAVGVANIMIISVLERRSEIGLRRALGATKGHIRTQFLSEAILLGLLGGTVGVALGTAATIVYAHTKHWATTIPIEAWAGGILASLTIGAVAGLLPALRAARLSPTQALRTV